MRLIRGLHNLSQASSGCVASIGNFDGVHLGHQRLFDELKAQGQRLGLPSTLICFEPQPLEFFAPDRAPARLTRLREKLRIIQAAGIDQVLLLRFNRQLAELSAQDFVQRVLVQGLGVRFLFVGDDFRFGQGRKGNVELLRHMGQTQGFELGQLHTLMLNGSRISSTRIREALSQGDLNTAAACLGRAYSLCGRVEHGNKRGRSIGFPTANLNLQRLAPPLSGVFAVHVYGLEAETALQGVANLGTRPTVGGQPKRLLEVHLFDFDRSVYGQRIRVDFVARLRPERSFESFEALRQQIDRDATQARALLADT